jgi:hypothetical protein
MRTCRSSALPTMPECMTKVTTIVGSMPSRLGRRRPRRKYRYVMEPLDASVSENIVKLRARLTGDFPGSPVELDYTFTVANDKITSLEIK